MNVMQIYAIHRELISREKKENIPFIFKYLWRGFIDIIFTFKVNIIYSLWDLTVIYFICLNFEGCILYFICFEELFGDMKLPYMPDAMHEYCSDRSQRWHWYFILGLESQGYVVSLVVIMLHNDVLWDLKIKQSFN